MSAHHIQAEAGEAGEAARAGIPPGVRSATTRAVSKVWNTAIARKVWSEDLFFQESARARLARGCLLAIRHQSGPAPTNGKALPAATRARTKGVQPMASTNRTAARSGAVKSARAPRSGRSKTSSGANTKRSRLSETRCAPSALLRELAVRHPDESRLIRDFADQAKGLDVLSGGSSIATGCG